MKLSLLTPNPSNPRTISEDAFARLRASLAADPELLEYKRIVVDESGTILCGNMRVRALLAIGVTDVPDEYVVTASNLTDEQRRKLVLLDNEPEGISGAWDWDVIANEYDDLDLTALGFEVPEVTLDDDEGELEEGDSGKDDKTTCPKCGHRF